MNKKVFLVVGAAAIALLLGLLVLGPGAARDVDAQGLVEYSLLFGSPNAFAVKLASFLTSTPDGSTVTEVWKPTDISDGCSHWETVGEFGDSKAYVFVLPGNDLLESLEVSPQTFIYLEIGPDSVVTICDRMLHAPTVEDFLVYDPHNPPVSSINIE